MPTFTPLHGDLTFLTPLSESRARRLVTFLAEDEPSTVLDVGCGWGELLLRVLEASTTSRGLGVDLDDEAVAAAHPDAAVSRAARKGQFRREQPPRAQGAVTSPRKRPRRSGRRSGRHSH